MCDCFNKINDKLKPHNTRLRVMIMLDPKLTSSPVIGTEQIETGRGKKKALSIAPRFCPFCGEAYSEGGTA